MGDILVALMYRPRDGGEPVPLAVTRHTKALAVTKAAVLAEAKTRATELGALDSGLEEVEAAELQRLRRILAVLVPGGAPDDWDQEAA